MNWIDQAFKRTNDTHWSLFAIVCARVIMLALNLHTIFFFIFRLIVVIWIFLCILLYTISAKWSHFSDELELQFIEKMERAHSKRSRIVFYYIDIGCNQMFIIMISIWNGDGAFLFRPSTIMVQSFVLRLIENRFAMTLLLPPEIWLACDCCQFMNFAEKIDMKWDLAELRK